MIRLSFKKMKELLYHPQKDDILIRNFNGSLYYYQTFLVMENYTVNNNVICGRGINLSNVNGRVNIWGGFDMRFSYFSDVEFVRVYLFRDSKLYYFKGSGYDKT